MSHQIQDRMRRRRQIGKAPRPHGKGRFRNQAGMTIVELILGISITTMVMVPLGAWAIAVMKAQPLTSDKMIKTVHAGFMGAYVPDDVASASAAESFENQDPPLGQEWWSDWSRSDCSGGAGSHGRKVMVLLSSTDAGSTTTTAPTNPQQVKTVYSIAESSGAPGTFSVWRRTCDATDHAPVNDSRELFKGIDPDLEKTKAECRSPAGELPCRQVRFLLTPKGANKPVVLNVLRRTDAEARLMVDDGTQKGNRVPAARISVMSMTSTGVGQETQVVLDASGSSDEDGSIANYTWHLPNAPVDQSPEYAQVGGPDAKVQNLTLPRAGTYSVELTVTDDRDASTTTYKGIVVENHKPVAVGSVNLTKAVPGIDAFSLTGSGSYDPDGSINVGASRWVLTGTAASGSEPLQLELHGLDHADVILGTEWALGQVGVMLVVVDNNGASDSFATSIELVDPVAPITEPPITEPPAPDIEPPAPVIEPPVPEPPVTDPPATEGGR